MTTATTPTEKAPAQETAPAHELDAVSLDSYVASPRARKHLADAGYRTIGDLRAKGLGGALRVKFVGEATALEIRRAANAADIPEEAPAAEEHGEPEIEEGPHPIRLRSRRPMLHLSLSPSHRVSGPGMTTQIQEPLFLEFEEIEPGVGLASLTREAWLMRHHDRDRAAVREAIRSNAPWRQRAVADLKTFANYGLDFWVLSD